MKLNADMVLLYNLEDTKKGEQIKNILLEMDIRSKFVTSPMYQEPIGALMEVNGMRLSGQRYFGLGFSEEMMVMKIADGTKLNLLLVALRERLKENVALKAVLTEHNRSWNSVMLLEEIREEHESMKKSRTF